ncbi:MAG: hypothetical protein QG628_475 [Patescibacteria group bacterium]|nr:hypothetical protein [Patescibacteria group bacterium]
MATPTNTLPKHKKNSQVVNLGYDERMKLFIIFGLIGTLELMVIFGAIHYVMSRNKQSKRGWLVPALALLCGFGYAFNIFIIEGEGSNSFGGTVAEGLPLYLFVFTFFSVMFSGLFVVVKSITDKK